MIYILLAIVVGLGWAIAHQDYLHGKERGVAERRKREALDKVWADVARAIERATRK